MACRVVLVADNKEKEGHKVAPKVVPLVNL